MATKKAPGKVTGKTARQSKSAPASSKKGSTRAKAATRPAPTRAEKVSAAKKKTAPKAAATRSNKAAKSPPKKVGRDKAATARKSAATEPKGGPASSKRNKATWHMRLYVAGDSPRSRLALNNLKNLCEERLKGDYEIEVIDLTKAPHLAKADQILAVPTLVRSIPEPMKRIIGDLSNSDRALVALDLDVQAAKIP